MGHGSIKNTQVNAVPIRPFQENDFPRLLEIYAMAKLDELKYEAATFELLPLDQDKPRLDSLLAADIYVYQDTDIVAYGAMFESEIRALFVHPESRGKGIGKALLEHLLCNIHHEAVLYVAKTNKPAKALYMEYGFEVVDEFATQYNGIGVLANKMKRAAC